MIKIEKAVTITISGEDVQVLQDICEKTRVFLNSERGKAQIDWQTGEQNTNPITGHNSYAISKLKKFMDTIFEA